jgi:hypothetical protein
MGTEDDVINQADALMRRHRSFVARSAETAADIAESETAPDDADIPLLTEVVDTEVVPPSIDALIDTLGNDIEAALSDWLVEALPAAVMNASQHILSELDAKARTTLLPQVQEILAARREKPID